MSAMSGAPLTAAEGRKVAREAAIDGAKVIKAKQDQALKDLSHLKLYIALYIRKDPPVANDFHWAFYYHKTVNGGTKYRIT